MIVMQPELADRVYGPEERSAMEACVRLVRSPVSARELRADPSMLEDVEILFTSWGVDHFDESLLQHAPRLKAVFHGAGSVRTFVTDALWERGIVVTSANAANAVPVAEYCVAAILFSLKAGFRNLLEIRENRRWNGRGEEKAGAGGYRSTVGFISFGQTARRTVSWLRPFDLRPIAWSPELDANMAAEWDLGARSFAEVFEEADVISVHTPALPETKGMIGEQEVRSMKQGATLINTARGSVIDQPGLLRALRDRPDLAAILDVTDPEPPEPGSAIFDLPNVFMTPHIAGATGTERRRCGAHAVEQCRLFLAGETLPGRVTPEMMHFHA